MEEDDLLERRRAKYKAEGKRLAYDCFNLKTTKGNRCFCSKGRRLSLTKDGTIDLRLILAGITPNVCLECPDFLSDDD
jgi:hypothetical protein